MATVYFERLKPSEASFVDLIYPGDQERFWLHFNHYWRDNAARIPDLKCYWVKTRDEVESEGPSGFIVLGPFFQDENLSVRVPGCYELIHMVIHRPRQKQGFGRAATLLALQNLTEMLIANTSWSLIFLITRVRKDCTPHWVLKRLGKIMTATRFTN